MLLCWYVLNQSSKLFFFVGKMELMMHTKWKITVEKRGNKCVFETSEAPMNECTEACNYHIKMESRRTPKVMFEIFPCVFLLGFARLGTLFIGKENALLNHRII